MASDNQFLDTDYDEYAGSHAHSAACFQSVALMVPILCFASSQNGVKVHGKGIASLTFLMFISSLMMLFLKICKLVALLLLRHILSMTGADDEDASTFFMVIVREIEGGEM